MRTIILLALVSVVLSIQVTRVTQMAEVTQATQVVLDLDTLVTNNPKGTFT